MRFARSLECPVVAVLFTAVLAACGGGAKPPGPATATTPATGVGSGGPGAGAAGDLDRTVLPVPEPAPTTITEPDARKATAPPRFEVKPPAGAPNILIVLIDDI